MDTCSICGRPIAGIPGPCPYNAHFGFTCGECCEVCYKTEPFPCREHDIRNAAQAARRNKEEIHNGNH